MTRTATTGSTARKVVGSLGVIGAAAAVAGLGTFGTFSDSATPVDNATVSTGTLGIDAVQQGSLGLNVTGLVPGDSITRAITLKNDGQLPLGKVSVSVTGTGSAVLTNGLTLALKSCPVAWTQSGNTFSCASGEKVLGSGALTANYDLAGAASLIPNGTDYIAYTVTLPTTADNSFQGQSAALKMTFTGTQLTGSAR
ncbi:TasA family protein [Blastococcus sp. TF02-8]|uniref:TasA family protein n=1 Tax=Blastococcus sp. TF02-8 TaxID=2250574 RepID=UPI001412DB9D|nr:TasA family protein [Blastococcus sp. TF02-8]